MSSAPSILLLGATGASGQIFLKYALGLDPKPKITVYVRNASKLPSDIASQVKIVQGDLSDRSKVDEAMQGVDAVVSVLGAYATLGNFWDRKKETPLATELVTVKESMKAHNVKRVLALSTGAHSVPGEKYNWSQWFFNQIMPPFMTPSGSATMTAIAELFHDESLDYTIFRVPFLGDEKDAKVYAGFFGPEYKGGMSLTRGSMSRWIYEEIKERAWVKQEPALGNF
ncbi:hypothetical protein P7C73_g507, partial [Tremellales sp. Uapishka_1]